MKKKNLDLILKASGFEDMGNIGETQLPIVRYLPKELLRDPEFLLKLKKKEIQNKRRMWANLPIHKNKPQKSSTLTAVIKVMPTPGDRPDLHPIFYTGPDPILAMDTKYYNQKILPDRTAQPISFRDFRLNNLYKGDGAAVSKGPHPERIGYDKKNLKEKRVRFEEIEKRNTVPRTFFFKEDE